MERDFLDDEPTPFPPSDPLARREPKPAGRNWILLLVLAGGLMFLLCCGGLGGLAFFGWSIFTGKAQAVLQNNPVVQEHIGEIREMKFDFAATGNEPGDDVLVIHVTGTKGSGTVTVKLVTNDVGGEELSGTLRMSTGEVYDLIGNDGPGGEGT